MKQMKTVWCVRANYIHQTGRKDTVWLVCGGPFLASIAGDKYFPSATIALKALKDTRRKMDLEGQKMECYRDFVLIRYDYTEDITKIPVGGFKGKSNPPESLLDLK